MCIFCRIAAHDLPARIVFEDDDVVVLRDAHPQAPTHLLVIPRKHMASLSDADEGDAALLGKLLLVARKVALEHGLGTRGYRLVVNSGPDAGQSVFHIHVHVLGGRAMSWPPG